MRALGLRWAMGLTLAATLTLSASTWAREVAEIESIKREARIAADVIKTALRREVSHDVRVTSVTGEFLARQGVLISVRLNVPWLTIQDGDAAIAINGQINLEEIPSMVENILSDLQIDVSPYEPEALEALRDLRAEQRELRSEQRALRAKLRERRRALVRADDSGERQDVEEDIAELERELQAVDAQYEALAQDIDVQYQELRDYRGGYQTAAEDTRTTTDYGTIIAQAACDYGSTLKSLKADNYLTFALRRSETADYYAFRMEHIYSCNRGDMRTERLLELAYQYSM